MNADEIKAAALNHPDAVRYYTPDETRALLSLDTELRDSAYTDWAGTHRQVALLYGGRWLVVNRCDLFHQCHTGLGAATRFDRATGAYREQSPRKRARESAHLGSVVMREGRVSAGLYIIDSFTDG